jgi:deoxyribodipyrimidine photo-lyase
LKQRGIGYLFYLRQRRADPNNAFYRLAEDAFAVVSDDYPAFITPSYNTSVAPKLPVPYYAVDSSCVVPMAHLEKQEYAAYTIRPKIHKVLAECLTPVETVRLKHRFTGLLPCADLQTEVTEGTIAALVESCEIDHTVPPSTDIRGGRVEAEARLERFLENNLRRYAKYAGKPSARATSELSSHLHFGQISSLEIALAARAFADEHKLMAQEFLEQLIVRRELAFNFARFAPVIDSLKALPDWARATLAKHDRDKREIVYTPEQFERASTHDALWNAAQTELLTRGIIHGYYRMYWGKKIIEWSRTHAEALRTMIDLHDRYALDGRDPNTYTNILWCFGLHDRPWMERPVFGMIRYMSHDGMRRKTDVDEYIEQVTSAQGSLL